MVHYLPVWIAHRSDRRGWWVGWRDKNGKQHQRRAGNTKEHARAFAAHVERQINSWLGGAVISWQQVKREFQISIMGRSQSHKEVADRVLAAFDKFLVRDVPEGEPPPVVDARAIQPREIDQYLGWLTSRGQPASLREQLKHYRYLHAVFDVARRRGLVEKNPVSVAARPRPPAVEHRIPRGDSWIELLHAIPQADVSHHGVNDPQAMHLLIVLAFTTGLRRSDLLALTAKDVELGTKATRYCGLLHARNRKGGKTKVCGLPPLVDKMVSDRINALPDGDGRLFPWPRFPRHAWERLCVAAGLPGFHFHWLRTISGTNAAIATLHQAGANHLQHSSTQVYQQHYAQADAEALEVARNLRVPALPSWKARRPNRAPRSGRSESRGRRGSAGNRRAASGG